MGPHRTLTQRLFEGLRCRLPAIPPSDADSHAHTDSEWCHDNNNGEADSAVQATPATAAAAEVVPPQQWSGAKYRRHRQGRLPRLPPLPDQHQPCVTEDEAKWGIAEGVVVQPVRRRQHQLSEKAGNAKSPFVIPADGNAVGGEAERSIAAEEQYLVHHLQQQEEPQHLTAWIEEAYEDRLYNPHITPTRVARPPQPTSSRRAPAFLRSYLVVPASKTAKE